MAGDRAPLPPDEGAVMSALLSSGSRNAEFWKNQKVLQW